MTNRWPEINEAPVPCPRCDRIPRSHSAYDMGTRFAPLREPVVGYRFECRRWFGLRPCFGSQLEMCWNTKDWSDLARRRAAADWNDLVKRFELAALADKAVRGG